MLNGTFFAPIYEIDFLEEMNNNTDNQAIPDDLDELERKFLATNVFQQPDMDELNRFEIDSDFSVDEDMAHLEVEEMFHPENGTLVEDPSDWSTVLSSHRKQGNTGPKGVLEDYKEARKITARRNETKALKQQEYLKKIGYNYSSDPTKNVVQKSSQAKKIEDDEEVEDEDEDEFFKRFRALRLQQLSAVSGLPQYGKLREVNKFEFVDEVDHSDPKTFVVIHLYEDYILSCERMNKVLQVLASRYPHINFLKLKATEADQTLSHKALPAFLVYRGGKLAGNVAINTAKTELHNEKFTEEDVEFLLVAKYGVNLPGVDISRKEIQARENAQKNEEQDQQANELGVTNWKIVERFE